MEHDAVNPITGWNRARWVILADATLHAVRAYASPNHGQIHLPGVAGGYGRTIDGLEGFTRTLLLAGFRLKGENGADPNGYAEWYAEGIAAGVDPDAPETERWVPLTEQGQPKVEAASTALILDMTRPWIWDQLSDRTQNQVIEYFSPVVGDQSYPRNNWCWFRLVTQTFLKSVDGPWSLDDMEADLALHDSFSREDGWYSDGDQRAFDHYTGWALHLYPTLWARMSGSEELAKPRAASDKALLDRFLRDAIKLVGADGAPLIQGRSLAYRFAAAAPFWTGALAEVPSLNPGQLRRAASGIVDYFGNHGVPDEGGRLTPGWFSQWLPMLQSYTGPGSPYWASKGMLGLALPADHPAWMATEQPLPVELADTLDVFAAPGWIVSGTHHDGIVRIVNHGTDHADEGDEVGDSPLYTRLGYSTATWPWVDEGSWRQPSDQSVALVDCHERVTHRAGFRRLTMPLAPATGPAEAPVAVAGSQANVHWIDMPVKQTLHGSGWEGDVTPAGVITVISLVRGPWELRLSRVDSFAIPTSDDAVTDDAVTLRISGWPTVAGDGLTSTLEPVAVNGQLLPAEKATLTRSQVSPFGPGATIPTLNYPAQPGQWIATLVGLTRTASSLEEHSGKAKPAQLIINQSESSPNHSTATVTWPDGIITTTLHPLN